MTDFFCIAGFCLSVILLIIEIIERFPRRHD